MFSFAPRPFDEIFRSEGNTVSSSPQSRIVCNIVPFRRRGVDQFYRVDVWKGTR